MTKLTLRIKDDDIKKALIKKAQKQQWSLNTLINSVLEDFVIMNKSPKTK